MPITEIEETQRRDIRFLIVDDNKTNQLILVKMLNRLGFAPDLAESGKMACEMAAKIRYHIILMDIMMPDMNGVDTARTIRAMLPAQESPVIIGLSAGDFGEMSLTAGMDHFIPKPFTLSHLKKAIERFIV